MNDKLESLISELLTEISIALDSKKYEVVDCLSRAYQRIVSSSN